MTNLDIIRELAKEYAGIALSDACRERVARYRELNSRKMVRPPVLVFEVPIGEFAGNEELRCLTAGSPYHGMEWEMRAAMFQFRHYQGDYAVHPYYRVHVGLGSTGTGLNIKEKVIPSTTGAYIASHEYEDVLPDEDALENIRMPQYFINHEDTQRRLSLADEVFSDILPYKKAGHSFYFAAWDNIPRYHGVENSICDLYDRPEFVHKVMEKFTRISESTITQYEELNILDTDPYYLHCTPAATYDLPVKDMDSEKIYAKDVWCRAMAQIFAVVSPEMHEEFDLQYTKRLFDRCGLAYYGCCEPLDTKIDCLRQFQNLRRISITPWANPELAAEKIGRDYVFSYKSNPAFVAGKTFDPEPVRAETERVIRACQRNGTPLEFVLKDISTVSNNVNNLTRWVDTVNAVIDRYY